MTRELTKEMFQEYFEYDPESPSGLRWKVNRYSGKNYKILKIRAGDVAGSIQKPPKGRDNNYTYWIVTLDTIIYKAHRVIYCLCYGGLSADLHIDHVDGNPLNNVIENLRSVTHDINMRNLKKYSANTSGVSGVEVQIVKNTGYDYVRATWREENDRKSKCFSIKKYGYDLAFELACKHREQMIAKLNENGAGYTERHGQDE